MTEELIPHLFRTEYRKIVSVLSKAFGIAHIETAEDIASDTFLLAAETWGQKGLPGNPVAWLYTVAKNKTKNHLQRETLFQQKIAPNLATAGTLATEADIDLSEQNIEDSQLQMMFALCHPAINTESQVSLCLRILCGFGIDEVADAFLDNKEAVNKRLFRAKEKLRTGQIKIEFPAAAEIDARLSAILTTLYLLFTEGYYSVSNNATLRKDLCLEAIRLTYLLTQNARTDTPQVSALLSLMCFHASRFDARLDKNGEIILYEDQDTTLWSPELIDRGSFYLNRAATGNTISRYHLEAAIGYWHTQKEDTHEKWENILQLYNQLLQLEYSPIAALNRTYALSRANGVQEAIKEAEKLKLTGNHFYYTLLGELYRSIDAQRALAHFQRALSLARTPADRNAIQQKIAGLL